MMSRLVWVVGSSALNHSGTRSAPPPTPDLKCLPAEMGNDHRGPVWVSFVRSRPGNVAVTSPRLSEPESLHVAAPRPGRQGEAVWTCVQGKRSRDGEPTMVSAHAESLPGRGAMETEGAPGVCPQCPGRTAAAAVIFTAERDLQVDQESERDCRVTQRPGGRCPPQDWKSKEGVTQRQGAAPRQGLEGKGETGYFLETGSGLHPLMPLGICWNLSHWAEQEPLGPAWPCPLPTSDAHSSLGAAGVAGRQAEGQAQGREPPDECPAKWQRGVIS